MPDSCTVKCPMINIPIIWKKNSLPLPWSKVETMGFIEQTRFCTLSHKSKPVWRLNFTGSKCLQAVLMSLVKSRLRGFIGLFRSEILCKAEKEMKLDRNPHTNNLGTSAEIANGLLSHCLSTDALPSSSAMAAHLDLHQTTTVNGNGPVSPPTWNVIGQN